MGKRKRKGEATADFVSRIHYEEDKLYQFIVNYKHTHDGNCPSIREMMDGTDTSSTSVVSRRLRALMKRGLIRMPNFTSRAVEVIGGRWDISSVDRPVPYRVTQAGRDALREGTEDV